MNDLFNYLMGTNWLLFSILLFGGLMIGVFIISAGAQLRKGTIGRAFIILFGVCICGCSLILYINRYIDSFKVILKWIGIGFLIIFALACISGIFIFISERDVNSTRRAKCKHDIVAIISAPKYMDKVLSVGKTLTQESNIVLYPDNVINPVDKNHWDSAQDMNKDKIRLADKVYVVAENANTDDFYLSNLISYAENLNKKIVYDIGSSDAYGEDIIREAVNMKYDSIQEDLASRDYSRDAIAHIFNMVNTIKKMATADEIKDFADGKISLEYLSEKYNF